MREGVRASFHDQAAHCDHLGLPLTARVLRVLADSLDQGAVAGCVLNWSGDPAPQADALALRLAGGLHALVLSGADPDLAAAYADGTETALRAALVKTLCSIRRISCIGCEARRKPTRCAGRRC